MTRCGEKCSGVYSVVYSESETAMNSVVKYRSALVTLRLDVLFTPKGNKCVIFA
jgi:hypothetical protein